VARALVVYESMFGNTAAVAEAVAGGLGSRLQVSLREVGNAATAVPDDVDLVVVGGPTHALGLSRHSTRKDAAEQADRPLVSTGLGVREWLDAAAPQGMTCRAAAFDTRCAKPRLPGSAARAAVRRLRRAGFQPTAAPASFYVTGTKGPLVEGELERARRWAEGLAASVADEPLVGHSTVSSSSAGFS
jgi:hypothetical protein